MNLSNLKSLIQNWKLPIVWQQGITISLYFVLAYVCWDSLPPGNEHSLPAKEFITATIAFISSLLGLAAYTLWVNSWWNK